MTCTTSGCGRRRRRAQRAGREGVDQGIGWVLLVHEDLGVLAGGGVPVPHLRRLACPWSSRAPDVVPVTQHPGWVGEVQSSVGAAVPVVVHPGVVGSEWREVEGEVRCPTVVLVAGRSGRVFVVLRRRSVPLCRAPDRGPANCGRPRSPRSSSAMINCCVGTGWLA